VGTRGVDVAAALGGGGLGRPGGRGSGELGTDVLDAVVAGEGAVNLVAVARRGGGLLRLLGLLRLGRSGLLRLSRLLRLRGLLGLSRLLRLSRLLGLGGLLGLSGLLSVLLRGRSGLLGVVVVVLLRGRLLGGRLLGVVLVLIGLGSRSGLLRPRVRRALVARAGGRLGGGGRRGGGGGEGTDRPGGSAL
jgi:hypothetical protein